MAGSEQEAACPKCGHPHRIDGGSSGGKWRCQRCGAEFPLDELAGAAEAADPQPAGALQEAQGHGNQIGGSAQQGVLRRIGAKVRAVLRVVRSESKQGGPIEVLLVTAGVLALIWIGLPWLLGLIGHFLRED